MQSLISEDDIRTKVVYEWLACLGFSLNEISIEYSLHVQLGRSVRAFHPRTDILVKSSTGSNLLIVEVKEPNHRLSDVDKNQAISYARAVKGNIAPFAIITNGLESLIFDSITAEQINGETIPANHPYVTSGMKVTSDGIKERLEAVRYLISLSSENLLAFCQGQVENRISLLKGNDIYSGKKYIPELYVERQQS